MDRKTERAVEALEAIGYSAGRMSGALHGMVQAAEIMGYPMGYLAGLACKNAKLVWELRNLTGCTREELQAYVQRGWKLHNLRRFYLRWGRLPVR